MLEAKNKSKKRIGIIRGGMGDYYTSSLKKGGDIISYIFENLSEKYRVFDILIDKKGVWHLNGVPVKPADLIHKIDVIWNTTHPSVSVILKNFSIPNIGADSFSTVLENSKEMLEKHMAQIGLKMPRCIVSPKSAKEVFEKFGSPWIVKKNNEAKVVKTFDELAEIINSGSSLTVEEFITGKIASVHSLPKFRNQHIYTFPIGNSFGIFSADEKEKLATLTKDLHKYIGAKHYLKLDFILDKRGKVYLLGIESTPNLKLDSHFSQVCESVGAKMHQVVEHILEQV